ncbi:hypothetical protein BD560DRAFT_428656 [Blakeslea trispora]|nr:hypothetical protein BD560DRAFT_428656 [Blakeslea trispora]
MFQCSCIRYLVVVYHNLSIPFSITRFRVKSISPSRHLTISPSHHLTISPSHPDAKVDKVAIMNVDKAEVSTKHISGNRVSYQNGQKRKDFNSDNLATLADALDILACDIEANECCYAQPTLPISSYLERTILI